jgi:hypothetical protein
MPQHPSDVFKTRDVPFRSRLLARLRPPAVAIHNECNVRGYKLALRVIFRSVSCWLCLVGDGQAVARPRCGGLSFVDNEDQ